MTGLDGWFLGFLVADALILAFMGFVGFRMMQTAKEAQRQIQPALTEAKAVADLGKAMAMHAKEEGQLVAGRVKRLTAVVKQRAETTKRLAADLKPATQETLEAARETGEELRHTAESLRDTAASVGEIARRLGRVREKAQSAAVAARTGGC